MNAKRYCAFLLLAANSALATPIYLDTFGREWLDVNDTRYRSWNDVSQVCSAATGACSGTLVAQETIGFIDRGNVDVSVEGYIWATRDEVRELFMETAGLPADALDDYQASFPSTEGFGAAAFSVFNPTITFDEGYGILSIMDGLTRDGQGQISHHTYVAASDHFSLSSYLFNFREPSIGVYLYRNVTEPSALLLAALGFAGLALALLVRKVSSARMQPWRRRSTPRPATFARPRRDRRWNAGGAEAGEPISR